MDGQVFVYSCDQRKVLVPERRTYRWMSHPTWMPGRELGSSVRAVCAANYGAITPAPKALLTYEERESNRQCHTNPLESNLQNFVSF